MLMRKGKRTYIGSEKNIKSKRNGMKPEEKFYEKVIVS